MDEDTGNSSRLVDLPNGGFSILMGNHFMQGPYAQNSNLVGYGLEGLTNTVKEIYIVNNTFVNKRSSGIFLSFATGTSQAKVFNNIFAGTGTVINGSATSMSNNLTLSAISSVKFVNESAYNYKILSDSTAVDAGTSVASVNGNSLTPDFIYSHPTSSLARSTYNILDIGAMEYQGSLAINEVIENDIQFFPNPVKDFIYFSSPEKIKYVSIIDFAGKLVMKTNETTKINLQQFSSGVYFLKIFLKNGTEKTVKIIHKP